METAIGMVKLYAFAAEKVRVAPEVHELGVLCCYELTNQKLIAYPLRRVLE